MKTYFQDEQILSGLWALGRTIVNLLISLVDMIPVVGEIPSWLADIGKLFGKRTDLTPDVSIQIAWGTELIEFLTNTLFPSHLVETVLQLRHDVPRMRVAWRQYRRLARGAKRQVA